MDNFEEFEKFNAQMDVWIDDEEYVRIFGQEKGAIRVTELADKLKTHYEGCFRSSKSTHDKDRSWYNALNLAGTNPIKKVYYKDLPGGVADVNAQWAPLFYAKLFRARIKERGTDCFNRRLDDVLQYLEKQLPSAYSDDKEERKQLTRLTVLYLLELSAISQAYASLGFSEHASRIIQQSKQILPPEISWFYDLWARYNIGVAYFHVGRYRLAIREFNYIIKEVSETYKDTDNEAEDDKKKKDEKRIYFSTRFGNLLIYIPSVLYRADIQLKLQLAYHALDTLNQYFSPDYMEKSLYEEIHRLLIQAEANRQVGNLDNSWDNLKEACGKLFNKDKSSVLRRRVNQPPIALFDSERKQYWNLKERFINLFVEDELDWLEDKLNQLKSNKIKLKVSSDLTELEKEKIKTDCEKDEKEIINCARMLKNIFSSTKYFKRVRFYAYGRQGYYQQLARLLDWLAKKDETRQDDEFYKMAGELYEENKIGLMQDEEKMKKVECPYCEWWGINLSRLGPEHYKWFTTDMLNFYENMKNQHAFAKQTLGSEE